MVVRIVTYAAESREAARQWIREHADEFREAPAVEQVTFICSRKPPRVGAIMVFESADAMARYMTTSPFEWLLDSLQRVWADGDEPVREEAYRVMDL